MLQYSPNSDFPWFSVKHSSRGKYPFLTLSGVQGSGASPTVSWAAERASSPLSEPWVAGYSSKGTWTVLTLGNLGNTLEHSGMSWHILACPGMSWQPPTGPWTLWQQSDHPGPSWTILRLHLPWKILCSKKIGWVALWVPNPVILV